MFQREYDEDMADQAYQHEGNIRVVRGSASGPTVYVLDVLHNVVNVSVLLRMLRGLPSRHGDLTLPTVIAVPLPASLTTMIQRLFILRSF
jgi:hypothetical protein